MTKRQRIGKWIVFLGMVLIVPGLLIAAFECAAYDANLHIALHDQMGSAEAAGIERAEMVAMSEALVAYLKDEADTFPVIIAGNGVPLVGETMEAHMIDVRALFILAKNVRNVLLCAGAILLIGGCFLSGKRSYQAIQTGSLKSVALWIVLLSITALFAAMDFSAFFTRFHELFFTNDLWWLNPATDPIILMLPQEFFLSVAIRAVIYMICALALFLLLASMPRILSAWRQKRT